ncbi:MAG: HAD-IC family P-type ATPase, partial [Actinomycetales bacterium]|nr:HAD-IC family P-type ATPase [Actinomycetales bacterium]
HTAVAVAVDGRFAGSLVLRDTLRENAAAMVRVLRQEGLERVVMLTGDNPATARSLAAQAGIEETHAGLLPEDKVRLVGELPPAVVMVGDGVNDAPVLAAADVGIAMGARGSTAASESADVVIMTDDVGKVVQALDIGRHTYRVALTAIWIGVLLSLGLMGIAAFGHIPAVVGALTQELVDLACILYALRALRGGPTRPELRLETRPADGIRTLAGTT